MQKYQDIIIAAKCAPQKNIFAAIKKAGLRAIKSYLSSDSLRGLKNIKTKLCVENTYSVHEPLKLMRRYGLKDRLVSFFGK